MKAIEHDKGKALKFGDVGAYIKFDRLRGGGLPTLTPTSVFGIAGRALH